MNGREPTPYNLDAEQAVLGAILLDNAAIDTAMEIICPEDFSKESHRDVYKAMLEMKQDGEAIDIITLTGKFRKAGKLNAVGGAAFLATLVNKVPNAANIKYHCRIVKDNADRRGFAKVFNDALDEIKTGHDLADVVAKTRNSFESISNELTASAKIPLISSVDFMAQEANEIDWVVKDFIASGTLNLLAGSSSGYKTWLSMYLGLCVAEGRDFIGRKVIKTTVIYIDRENPRTVWKDRLSRLGESACLKLWPSWDEPPSLEKGNKVYLALAKEKPLMILDSLIRFHSEEENEASGMSRVMGNLRALCNAGATVLVLHHMGKDEDSLYRGSSEILGGVDAAYTLRKAGNKLFLKGIKNRLISEPNVAIRLVEEDQRISFKDITGEESEKRKEKLQGLQELIKTLSNGSSELPNQSRIVEAAIEKLGYGRPTVRDLLMEGEGTYWVKKRGPKRAVFYSVLED